MLLFAETGAGRDGQATRPPCMDRLGRLPDELLLRVFETLERISKHDLCSVSRLNKRYHTLSDAVLYKRVWFNTPELHLTFSESLGRRPRRGSTINEIKLLYPASELSQLELNAPVHNSHYDPIRFDTLSRTLSIMSNLKKLDIAVPDTLLHGIGTIFNGPFDLACLKECSLFYQCADDAYWDLRENIHVFGHPDLETLIIRRAKLDEQGLNLLERPDQTALKKLHFIDCDINDDGLSDLLELAEALEEFVLTQPAEPSPPLEESSDNFHDYILALNSQAHSLRTLTIDSPSLSSRRAVRMRDYVQLKSIRLNWDYQLFGKAPANKPRLHSAALPPSLETLEFLNELGTDDEVMELLLYMIETRSVVASSWKSLVVPEGEGDDEGAGLAKIKAACRAHDLRLDVIGQFDNEAE